MKKMVLLRKYKTGRRCRKVGVGLDVQTSDGGHDEALEEHVSQQASVIEGAVKHLWSSESPKPVTPSHQSPATRKIPNQCQFPSHAKFPTTPHHPQSHAVTCSHTQSCPFT